MRIPYGADKMPGSSEPRNEEAVNVLRRMLWTGLVMPVGGLLTRQPVGRHLRYYQRSQSWPVEKLEAERDRLLRGTVAVAYRDVPLYRDLFDAAGVAPADIRGVADLPLLPVVTKDMIREAWPDRCTRKVSGPVEHQATSGSTGHPFHSVIDADSQARARALMFLRAMMSGYRPGDSVLQTGSSAERGGLKSLKDRLLGVHYVPTFDMTDPVLDRCLDEMERHRIPYLMGTAQTIFLIARRAAAVGRTLPLKGAVSWGSLLLPEHRRAIADAFGCRVIDTYGVSEGMQIAAQCGQDHGEYHQFALHVVAEICEDGRPVPPGGTGDVLLTRLNPGAMPFIRYRVGDRAVASTRTSCPCGRSLPLMAAIEGRTSDLVVTPGGNRLAIHFFSSLIGHLAGVESFQVVQDAVDRLHVKLAVSGAADPDLPERIAALIREKGDPALQITTEIVDGIPLEKSGKQKYIVSNVELT